MEEALGIPLDLDFSCYVYCITCSKNGKKYVGISNDVARRFKEHTERSRDSASHSKLHRAIRKYGEDVFTVEVVTHGCREYCALVEVALIWLHDSNTNGYNSSDGGEGSSYYKPWNKGTKGLCKANKTSFVKGGKSARQKLTDEDIERILLEYSQGVPPKKMNWLPVHWANAYRVIRKNKS